MTTTAPKADPQEPDTQSGPTPAPARMVGLDRFRAAALLLMLVHHITEWLTFDARLLLPGWEGYALTDTAAPAFAMATGASVALYLAARRGKGASAARTWRVVVRRYGLLVPTGVLLALAVFGRWAAPGVLEVLGVAALITAVVVWRSSPLATASIAAVVLAASPAAERLGGHGDRTFIESWLAGTFPVVAYVGFVLCGAGLVRLAGRRDRPMAAALSAAALLLIAAAMWTGGLPPDRYPGGPQFIVPGIGFSLALYALVAATASFSNRTTWLLDAAGRHTLGVYLSHHLVFVAADRTGFAGEVPAAAALPVAVGVSVALVMLAAVTPPLPWTPREGWRTPARRPGPWGPCHRPRPGR